MRYFLTSIGSSFTVNDCDSVTRALGRFWEAVDVTGWETMSDAVMHTVSLALSVCNRLEPLEASGVVQTQQVR